MAFSLFFCLLLYLIELYHCLSFYLSIYRSLSIPLPLPLCFPSLSQQLLAGLDPCATRNPVQHMSRGQGPPWHSGSLRPSPTKVLIKAVYGSMPARGVRPLPGARTAAPMEVAQSHERGEAHITEWRRHYEDRQLSRCPWPVTIWKSWPGPAGSGWAGCGEQTNI